jgi:hypothetical protein
MLGPDGDGHSELLSGRVGNPDNQRPDDIRVDEQHDADDQGQGFGRDGKDNGADTSLIIRSFDARLLNRLANDPDIRPFIGGNPDNPLDLSAAVANADNVFLAGEFGAFCCSWTAPDTYEIHTLILPEGRGKWAYRFAKGAREWMREFGAKHLWTRVAPDARGVASFTRKAGFSACGQNTIDLGAGPVTYDLFEWRA